jgi:hypothetical protein
MKTRQEMIYDFMQALCCNGAIFKDWNNCDFPIGSYGEHIMALAEEMADKYLSEAA